MPGDPQECRENAKRCLDMAQAAATQAGRKRFEMLARKWLALATDYDAANLLLTNWGDLPSRHASVPPIPKRDN
jgi:hypothetical protein